jgi:hypothetical protein
MRYGAGEAKEGAAERRRRRRVAGDRNGTSGTFVEKTFVSSKINLPRHGKNFQETERK